MHSMYNDFDLCKVLCIFSFGPSYFYIVYIRLTSESSIPFNFGNIDLFGLVSRTASVVTNLPNLTCGVTRCGDSFNGAAKSGFHMNLPTSFIYNYHARKYIFLALFILIDLLFLFACYKTSSALFCFNLVIIYFFNFSHFLSVFFPLYCSKCS